MAQASRASRSERSSGLFCLQLWDFLRSQLSCSFLIKIKDLFQYQCVKLPRRRTPKAVSLALQATDPVVPEMADPKSLLEEARNFIRDSRLEVPSLNSKH